MQESPSGSNTASQSTTSEAPGQSATYRMTLACGTVLETVPAPTDLTEMQTLCPQHEALEPIEKAERLSGVKLYVFVELYDGVTDHVRVFTEEKEAEAHYKACTGFDYGVERDGEDDHSQEHWSGTEIFDIGLGLDQAAHLFSNLLNDPDHAKVEQFMGKLQAANKARMGR